MSKLKLRDRLVSESSLGTPSQCMTVMLGISIAQAVEIPFRC